MPPKQKQAKKGPNYKNPVPSKDLVSPDIKQPPRQLKPLKYPENFVEPPKNDKKPTPIFQSWPTQQAIKSFDFGINSQTKFQDPLHESIVKEIKHQNIMAWKSLHEIQKLKTEKNSNSQQKNQSMKSINQNGPQYNLNDTNQQNIAEGPYKEPVVIQTYQRDQNQQQMQARLKKQAQKAELAAKDKKKGKKQQPKEQGPIKVRDVKMADVKVQGYMAQQGIWIGSQLQIIKLRNLVDVYNKQPVWKKIYPQQNGVPQITKSGKYWVKLYYMGEPIKVQVDDRLPINFKNKQMFSMSENRHQKWTLILTKALIKYMKIVCPQQKISGSGIIFHALTGMISQSLSLKNSDLQKFKELLNDSHYTNKDIFVCCHTNKTIVPPSNQVKHNKTLEQGSLIQQKDLYQKQQAIYEYNKQDKANQSSKPLSSNIILNYGYLLGDYFTNEDFNMAFSKQKSVMESKLRQQYNNLSKVNLNNKTRDQKLQHRRKKKQIKQLLALQEKKRLELINQEQKEYHFIKLLNKSIKIKCQFEQKQILLAKKCKINNLKQPPNYQLPQVIQNEKQQTKSTKSFSIIKNAKQQSEVNPNIDDFSMLENVIQPLKRPQQGTWIKDIDFLACFDSIQIVYNPAFYQNKSIQKVIATDNKSYNYDEKKEILVLQKIQLSQDGLQTQNIQLLFGFSYQENIDQNSMSKPYCILQKFDFDQFSVSNNVTKLTNKIDSNNLTLKNQNNVFKIYTICKGNYSYWISSNAKFKLMSISDYLEQFEGYKKKTFPIEYPALQSKSYFPLARFTLKQKQGQYNNSVIFKIVSQNQQITKYLSYNLVNIPKQQKYVDLEDEGVIHKNCEKKFLAVDYTRISVSPSQQYDLVLESCPLENVADGNLQVIVLIKNQSLALDYLEQVQPLKIIQKYKPNKYALIFRERLFSNTITHQGFLVKIVEGEQVQGGGGGGGDKKAAKKGGKQQSTTQYVQKALQKQRTFIFRILKNKQVLYEAIGRNWISISDILLPNIKQKAPNTQFFLQAYFDLREWPQASTQNEDTVKLCWTISTFGTDSIALVRDTRQEERQKQTRKSWEDKQAGRAQRAKKSRRRFLMQQKKQNGQQLTEQQQQLIAAPRMTKKQQLQQQKKNEDKNKKGAKKQEKKGAKQVKKQQVEQKPVQIVFPKSVDNCSYEIKSFLKTLQNFSVKKITKSSQDEQNIKIRSQQQLRAIKQSQRMNDQNRINKLQRNIQRRQTIKLKQRDKKDQLLIYLEDLNRQFKQNWTKYIAWRNQDLEKDKTKQEKQRYILEILKQEKPTLSETDLDKILNQYQGITNYNQNLYDVAVMLKKNIKIAALSDKITNHLTGWEVEELKAIRQQINNQKIQGIAQNILADMKTMLQQVQKNPAIVLQKQNQAKKAKKGGKK